MAPLFVAASDLPAAPVVGLMAAGVLIALYGHAAKSRRTVIVGLGLLFLATALLVAGAYVAFEGDQDDPRPRQDFENDAPF